MTMQDLDDVIKMFPEGASDEVLRSSENRPKRDNFGSGIESLVMSFDEKTYKSVNKLFTREQE